MSIWKKKGKLSEIGSLRVKIERDGWELTLDNGEDVVSLEKSLLLDTVVAEAAAFYARWKATGVLDDIRNEQFAADLDTERKAKLI